MGDLQARILEEKKKNELEELKRQWQENEELDKECKIIDEEVKHTGRERKLSDWLKWVDVHVSAQLVSNFVRQRMITLLELLHSLPRLFKNT